LNDFKVIPVLDILKSTAVHAIKGERAEYKPLVSKLIKSSNPLEIIQLLNSKYSISEFYIADLDAIINQNPSIQLLNSILKIPKIKIMIDPGIVNTEDVIQYSEYNINKLIIGLETIQNFQIIKKALAFLAESKIVISIDMYKGKILSKVKSLRKLSPIAIVKKLELFGIKELILLDLFRVGQKIGGIPSKYLEIKDEFEGKIYVGGGIKEFKDILYLKQQRFAGVLIATALFDGTINIEKLREFFI